jgi:gamma-glutamylcyclotransferase (GGCT)/AIG2-like uncharacterized protein YtfP
MSDNALERSMVKPADARCLLFVYGQLQPGHRPPRTASHARPDRVRGLLYDLGPYPAAVCVGSSDRWFGGHVLEIDERELEQLDAYEGVAEQLYRRTRTATESGLQVWVYEYARPLPSDAVAVDVWPRARVSCV